MAIRQNFLAYQQSLMEELKSTQDHVRHLIGSQHWQTDGEHKEASLRTVLRSRLPETVRVGRGFVCYPAEGNSSGQLDILITSKDQPTLYRDGELMFVTPHAVEAVAEVKTELESREDSRRPLKLALSKFADRIQSIRQRAHKRCWAGLFVFTNESISHRDLLATLQDITDGMNDRVIDSIAVGGDLFAHFWQNGRGQVGGYLDEPVWHSYRIPRLAPAYFIGNIVVHVSPDIPDDEQLAWFPIQGGKETKKVCYAPLRSTGVFEF